MEYILPLFNIACQVQEESTNRFLTDLVADPPRDEFSASQVSSSPFFMCFWVVIQRFLTKNPSRWCLPLQMHGGSCGAVLFAKTSSPAGFS